jgi:hypothetical protein
MSGPYLYRDEKLLHHGFIVASLIYGAMPQRSVRFPDIGGCTTGILTGRLVRLGERSLGRREVVVVGILSLGIRGGRCVITMSFYLPGAHIR